MRAAKLGVAGVGCAGIAVITKGCWVDGDTLARAGAAGIARGAGVAVVACHGVVCVHAAELCIATIRCAYVFVIATQRRSHALASAARVALAARVAVVAGQDIVGEYATT